MQKADTLIRTKLRLPFTRQRLVPRPRLHERIAEGLHGLLTLLSGSLPDQAALYGVLERIRDLNLTLISVARGGPSAAPSPATFYDQNQDTRRTS
jgi:hypothetical protein